jgi:hypothetical protein
MTNEYQGPIVVESEGGRIVDTERAKPELTAKINESLSAMVRDGTKFVFGAAEDGPQCTSMAWGMTSQGVMLSVYNGSVTEGTENKDSKAITFIFPTGSSLAGFVTGILGGLEEMQKAGVIGMSVGSKPRDGEAPFTPGE